jgi:hypothetical protein
VKTKYVILAEGLGNKLMHIFHSLHEINEVIFIWPRKKYIGPWNCTWEDLFEYPKLNIEYIENIPTENVFCLNDDPLMKAEGKWNFQIDYGSESHKNLVKRFIDSLIPSREVYNLIKDLKTPNDGHTIRVFHPNSSIGRTPQIKVPAEDFISTDSQWIRDLNSHAIQTKAPGAPSALIRWKTEADTHPSLREREGCIGAAADWLMLFKCNTIYQYGTINTKYECAGTSTFLHAHRLYGKQIINKTRQFQSKWKARITS